MTLSLHRAAQQRANNVATVIGDRTQTWAELGARVSRFAAVLHELGVEKGEPVAILALNSDRFLEYYLAVPWAGAAVLPLNIRWSHAEIAYAINDSGCKLLLIDDAYSSMFNDLQASCPALRDGLYIGDTAPPDGVTDFSERMNNVSGIQDKLRAGSDLYGIFYTSGTTAKPKGVMLSHQNICSSAVGVASELRFDPDDIYLHCAPMFRVGVGIIGFAALLASATHAFDEKFEVDRLIDAIEKIRVTHTTLVPTMIAALLDKSRIRSADLSSLKVLVYGASPMTARLLRRTIETLPNIDIFQGYGQTEMSPGISMLGPEEHVLDGPLAHRNRSVG